MVYYNHRKRKDTTTKASQRLQRELTNKGVDSQKGGNHSTIKTGLTPQNHSTPQETETKHNLEASEIVSGIAYNF